MEGEGKEVEEEEEDGHGDDEKTQNFPKPYCSTAG